jgi:plastocyanin
MNAPWARHEVQREAIARLSTLRTAARYKLVNTKLQKGRESTTKFDTAGMILAVALFLAAISQSRAQDVATIEISIKDQQFQPAETKAPAAKPLVLKVKNFDTAPVEFESKPLQFETIVKPDAESLVKVKTQKPGRYLYFNDLHPTTKGILIVE